MIQSNGDMQGRELPADYRAFLDQMNGITERAAAQITGQTPEKIEMQQAFATCLLDLRYPVAPDGSVMQSDYFAAFVAYHLVRCGWRPHEDKRTIKPRKVPGTSLAANAVEWVDMDADDDPLHNLANMTMADIARLPDSWRHEAIRRLGGNVPNDLPKPKSPWTVDTKINIAKAPRDPNEVFR
jgi:hypothetical protein